MDREKRFWEKPISRRDALRYGFWSVAGLLLADRLLGQGQTQPAVPAASAAKTAGKAKAVIQVWLWGGPSHLDTFDPKPEAGYDYCGPFSKPIPTNVDGIFINELLVELAKCADKYSLIRSMTHGINGHETAAYLVQTGRPPGDQISWPCIGAVVSFFKGYNAGYKKMIPPYIVITQPQGRFSESGFLGSKYKPFATGGDPAKTPFTVEGIVAEGVTEERQLKRREFLASMNSFGSLIPGNPEVVLEAKAREEAYGLLLGEEGKIFDLTRETQEMRDRYGVNTLGQSCLVARRLVEIGVPYVTINSGGWDTHKQHFQAMRQKLPQLDKALAALIGDLHERGLLDTTVVWCCGEFGRTPKVDWSPPWNGGRNHFGAVFSCLVAGGGFKGGRVVGASDAKGETVKERPVYPCDLLGSIYELLGIDPDATLPHPTRTCYVTPRPEEGVKMGGRLKEIM